MDNVLLDMKTVISLHISIKVLGDQAIANEEEYPEKNFFLIINTQKWHKILSSVNHIVNGFIFIRLCRSIYGAPAEQD